MALIFPLIPTTSGGAAGLPIQKDDAVIVADPTALNFEGGAIDVIDDGGKATVTVTADVSSRVTFSTNSNTDLLGVAKVYACIDTFAPRLFQIQTAFITDPIHLTNPQTFTVIDETGQASLNNITVDTEGLETISGLGNITISADYGAITFYSNGVNLFILP